MTWPLSIPTALARAAGAHAASALIDAGPVTPSRVPVGELVATVGRLAGGLESLGIRRAARVATLMANHRRHLEMMLATMVLGALTHPVNTRMPKRHLAHIFAESHDVCVVIDADQVLHVASVLRDIPTLVHVIVHGDVEQARSMLPARVLVHCCDDLLQDPSTSTPLSSVDPDLPALLSHTGGTSGNPKGVVHSHRQLLENALAFSLPDALAISSHDVLFPAVPLCHAFAWGLPVAALVTGASLVLDGGRTDAAFTAGILAGQNVTLAAGVPTVWERVRALSPSTGPAIHQRQRVVIGGAAPSLPLVQWFAKAGVEVLHCWGMTETAPFATVGRVTKLEQRTGRLSAGPAIAGVDLRIVDDLGNEVPRDGEGVGELEVRGPWVATSYLGESARPPDAWLVTGDLVRIDPRGHVFVVDRAKDVIKSGGEWISSLELEANLRSLDGVVDAAVVAYPDAQWGERPVAHVVVAGEGVSGEALRAELAARLPRWWVPDRIEIVEELPRTPLGKLDKRALRELIEAPRTICRTGYHDAPDGS